METVTQTLPTHQTLRMTCSADGRCTVVPEDGAKLAAFMQRVNVPVMPTAAENKTQIGSKESASFFSRVWKGSLSAVSFTVKVAGVITLAALAYEYGMPALAKAVNTRSQTILMLPKCPGDMPNGASSILHNHVVSIAENGKGMLGRMVSFVPTVKIVQKMTEGVSSSVQTVSNTFNTAKWLVTSFAGNAYTLFWLYTGITGLRTTTDFIRAVGGR